MLSLRSLSRIDLAESYVRKQSLARRLSWTVVIALLLQFASVVWFASNLNTRLCYVEAWMQKNEAAIGSLDDTEGGLGWRWLSVAYRRLRFHYHLLPLLTPVDGGNG